MKPPSKSFYELTEEEQKIILAEIERLEKKEKEKENRRIIMHEEWLERKLYNG